MKTLIAIAALLASSVAFAFDESVTVSWNDPGSEDSFQVLRIATACNATNAMGWSVVANPAADVLSFEDTVQDNATYCYQVRAVKDGTQGPLSVGFEVVVPASLAVITVSAVLN